VVGQTEANVADDEAIDSDESDDADEVDEANKSDKADKAGEANKADEADEVFLGRMQNAWASCLVLSSSCFVLVELIFWRIRCCSSCCGDLSHCRSCRCSHCGDMSNCYVIQNSESSSGTCCIRWDMEVQGT
jgi:hypothetical protein